MLTPIIYMTLFVVVVFYGPLRHLVSRDAMDTFCASYVCTLTLVTYMAFSAMVFFHGLLRHQLSCDALDTACACRTNASNLLAQYVTLVQSKTRLLRQKSRSKSWKRWRRCYVFVGVPA